MEPEIPLNPWIPTVFQSQLHHLPAVTLSRWTNPPESIKSSPTKWDGELPLPASQYCNSRCLEKAQKLSRRVIVLGIWFYPPVLARGQIFCKKHGWPGERQHAMPLPCPLPSTTCKTTGTGMSRPEGYDLCKDGARVSSCPVSILSSYIIIYYHLVNTETNGSQTLSCFILKSTSLRKTTHMPYHIPARMRGLFTWLHLGVLSVACNGEAAMTPSLWHHWNSGKNISDGKTYLILIATEILRVNINQIMGWMIHFCS